MGVETGSCTTSLLVLTNRKADMQMTHSCRKSTRCFVSFSSANERASYTSDASETHKPN